MSKLSEREKILLRILLWVVVAVAGGIYLYIKIEQLSDLNRRIHALEKQAGKTAQRPNDEEELLLKKQRLEALMKAEKKKYYQADDMDLYRFSITINDLLSSRSLAIKKYQTVEVKDGTCLEYSVSGEAINFVEFLESVAAADKYWNIPYLTIDARKGGGMLEAVFRITYETADEKNR